MLLYNQIFIAIIIVILCILVILYLIGFIDIPILQNIYFKLFATATVCTSFIFYLIGLYKKKYVRRYMFYYSMIFEFLGIWWLFVWIGYVFIALGVFLLPTYYNDWMEYLDERQKQGESKKKNHLES